MPFCDFPDGVDNQETLILLGFINFPVGVKPFFAPFRKSTFIVNITPGGKKEILQRSIVSLIAKK